VKPSRYHCQKQSGLDYFDNPEERLLRLLQNNQCISTGYTDLDKHLNGGLNRKEMTVFSANSGVGKSITMSNLAANFLGKGLNVCYISLELSEDVVAKRFDSIMTGVGQSEIFKNVTKISVLVKEMCKKMGRLIIKRMPESTTNANHIRAYLKEYERMYGHIPDVLCVDYMDIMTSNNKISAENLFVKDKYIAEELRAIANDFDLVLITASQQNRSGMQVKNDDLSQGQVAGGISKVNTADNWISIIQTPQMKAAGEYMLKFLKTRSSGGVGMIVPLRWCSISLRVSNIDEAEAQQMISLRKRDVEKYEQETGLDQLAKEVNGQATQPVASITTKPKSKDDILSLFKN
jgi:archaellum biogenesis ATPase FlaH